MPRKSCKFQEILRSHQNLWVMFKQSIAPICSLRLPNPSHYHFLQTRLSVWVMLTSGQLLLMFLESVPVHLNRGLCSRLWGVPPVRKRNMTKQCLPVSPALPALFPLAASWVCRLICTHCWALWTAYRHSNCATCRQLGLSREQKPSWSPSSEQGGQVKVRSKVDLSVCIEMKNTSS